MTVQNCTNIVHAPCYTCHQDIAGFRIELRENSENGASVEIEDVSGAEYTLFGLVRRLADLRLFEETGKNLDAGGDFIISLSALHDTENIPLVTYDTNGVKEGQTWPTIECRYYRSDGDDEGLPITPLGLPKSFPDFYALLAVFDDILCWMEGNPARHCTLSYTLTGGEETLLCHITRDNGELHSNCTTFSVSGLSL